MKKYLVKCKVTVNGQELVNYTSTARAENAADAIDALFTSANMPEPPKNADDIELTLSVKPS
jgi:hypothetical protein